MTFVDQIKNKVQLNSFPKRIISLVPSQSEYLWDLGLKNELVGISKFCIHPNEMFETITRVGGTKQLDIEKIKNLEPDLIIGNKEENVKEQIEELQQFFPVWMSDVNNLEEAYEMMLSLGAICDKKNESEEMVKKIRNKMSEVENVFQKKSVAYFIWNKPFMVAASNTFIHSIIKYVGLVNVFENKWRYPEIDIEELQKASPDYCFLSSEPFPFNNNHAVKMQAWLPNSKVILVDGEMFSWYGSHLLYLGSYLKNLKEEIGD